LFLPNALFLLAFQQYPIFTPHPSTFDFIILIIPGEEYELQSYSLCNENCLRNKLILFCIMPVFMQEQATTKDLFKRL
jgi:hypothetical protein